jgi:hypothetical protein
MTAPTETLVCLDAQADVEHVCRGEVEYREPLSPTGRSFPRCEVAWGKRLDEQERIDRDYPDSPHPPSWFDYTLAGESWDGD